MQRTWPAVAAATLAIVASATATGYAVSGYTRPQYVALVYIPAVLAAAALFGLRAGVAAALLSFFALNFFFVEPRFTFSVAEAPDLIALGIFLIVAALSGSMAGRLRETADRARIRANGLESIADFTLSALQATGRADILAATARAASRMTGGPAAVIGKVGDAVVVDAATPASLNLDASEQIQAARALERMAAEPAAARGWPGGRFEVIPLPMPGERRQAVLLASASDPFGEMEPQLAMLFNQARIAAERLELAEAQVKSSAAIEEERLRSAMLSSISHDLRTPLATILGSVTSIRELGDSLSPDAREDLLAVIEEDTRRLSRFVDDLLDMTRMQSGLRISRTWLELDALFPAMLDRLRHLFPEQTIHIETVGGRILSDPALIEQVIVNLVENAAKYSDAASPIAIRAVADSKNAWISVTDLGAGIPAADLARVFDPFFRGDDRRSGRRGQGLGLAICQGIVRALGGSIAASSPVDAGRGTRIDIRLPVEPGPEDLPA